MIVYTEQSLQEDLLQEKVTAGGGDEGQDGWDGDEDSKGVADLPNSADEVDLNSDSEMADEFPASSDDDSGDDDVNELAVEKKSKKLDKLKAQDEKLAEAELQESASAPEAVYELPTSDEMEEAPQDLQTVHQR